MIWICTAWFCVADIYLNKWLEDHWGINHKVNTVYRLLFGALMLYLFPMSALRVILYVVGAFTGYWQAFNIGLNFVRVPRKPLLYVSSGASGSVLDGFEKKHQTAVVLIRAILAVGCFVGYWLAR